MIGEGLEHVGAHLRPLLAGRGEHLFGFGDELVARMFAMSMARHGRDIGLRGGRGNQPVWNFGL